MIKAQLLCCCCLLLLTVNTAGLVRDFGPHLTADVVHAMGPRLTSALVGEFGGSFTSQLVRAFGYPLTAGEALFKGASTTYMQLAGISVGLTAVRGNAPAPGWACYVVAVLHQLWHCIVVTSATWHTACMQRRCDGGSFTSQLVRAFGYPLTVGEALTIVGTYTISWHSVD
jgi:hypothetical protein